MSNRETCQFCNLSVKDKYSLKNHLNRNKSCLKIRGLSLNTKFICKGCENAFLSNADLVAHFETCKQYIILKAKEECRQEYKEEIDKLKQEIKAKEKALFDIQLQNQSLQKISEKSLFDAHNQIQTLQKMLENIAIKAVDNMHETVIDIEVDENKDMKEDFEDLSEQEYKLEPLDIGSNLYIENRDDGYINVTNLCKAGNKKFNDWSRLDNTKAFLNELKRSTGIPVDLLIQSITGGKNEDRKTWVHPYVAINIAQWISPQFDVKVSSWIYEVMLTGKIDISKTKSFQQLRMENKDQKLRIQYLTKKYVKLQPRVQYNEKNVIYILTTPSHKKERKYILGKATNLTNRLSTYNKTDEHEVIYYQECPDEEIMAMIEQVVFQRLKDYREQANRERFILPENRTVELFIEAVKNSIEFLQ